MTRPPARRRRWPGLAGLVLLAAALRVGAIVRTDAVHAPAEENRLIAANLAAGRGFSFTEFGQTGPTAVRGPAYPMLLAAIGPERTGGVLAVNVIAGALTVLAAFSLTTRLASPSPLEGEGGAGGSSVEQRTSRSNPSPFPLPQGEGEKSSAAAPWPAALTPAAAWLAATAFAVWPTQVFAATRTQGLSIAVLLTLAAITLAWRRPPLAIVVGGLLAGLAALTEPSLAIALLLVAVAIGWRTHWADAALFVGSAMVLVAPWLYRNAVVFGRPMPLTSNGWHDAFLGNGDDANGSRNVADDRPAPDARLHSTAVTRISRLSPVDYDRLKVPEPQRVAVFRGRAWPWIAAHPGGYFKLCVVRAAKVFFLDPAHAAATNTLFTVTRWLLAMAAVTTAFMLPADTRRLFTFWMAGVVMAGALTVVEARLSVLMDVPQLLAVAGLASRTKAAA